MLNEQAGNRLSVSRLVDQGVVITMKLQEPNAGMVLRWNEGTKHAVAKQQEERGDWVVGLEMFGWAKPGSLKEFELKNT